jgi:hypothetical protein
MKKYLLPITSIFVSLALLGCSKERYDVLTKDDVIPVVEKQKFIASSEKIPEFVSPTTTKKTINNYNIDFQAAKGTVVRGSVYDFSLLDGQWVNYPIELEIQELYTPKDMILNRKPTVSNGKMLVTGGEVNIIATKDGKPLILNASSQFSIQVPATNPDMQMSVFYGNQQANGTVNWLLADSIRVRESFIGRRDSLTTGLVIDKSSYIVFPTQIGWINCDRFLNDKAPRTHITFTSEEPSLDAVYIFLYFDRIKSVIEVYDGKSLEVPVGEHAKVVCFAITEGKEVYSYFQDLIVAEGQKVAVKLGKTTKEEFLKRLEGL